MTGPGSAQNKAGELFIDLGVSGLGKTLKALNSVSASFLLTRNAAVQMAKPLIDVGKKTLGMAVDVGKLGSTLGIAYKDAYKLQYYFKHMNLNEGLVNDIEKLSEQFNAMKTTGSNTLTGAQQRGFNVLGLNPLDYYGGGFEKIQQLIKDVQRKSAGMNRTTAANAIQDIGLNTEWLYAFDRGVYDLSEALSISNEEIEAAIAASESLNEANLAMKNALEKAMVQLAPLVTEYVPQLANAIVKYTPSLVNALETIARWCDKSFKGTADTIDKVKNHPVLGNKENLKKAAIATGAGQLAFGPVGGLLAGSAAFQALDDKENLVKKLPGMIKSGGLGLPSFTMPFKFIAPNLSIVNHITGKDANDIAKQVGNTEQSILESMMNKYQVHNMSGK